MSLISLVPLISRRDRYLVTRVHNPPASLTVVLPSVLREAPAGSVEETVRLVS